MFNPKAKEAARRFEERRERENEAARLQSEVPSLETLKIRIQHQSDGRDAPEPGYAKLVVVASAPALFLIPCGNSRCVDGGHDITSAVMRALRDREAEFQGDDACHGAVGSSHCQRTIVYSCSATYRGAPPGGA